MRLPARLLHRKQNAYKNDFGHVLVLAGSGQMLGAGALTGLAAMRSGSGLVTVGVPQSLNIILQKKSSNVVMTWPLQETKNQSIDVKAFEQIRKSFSQFHVIAIGPGLSQHPQTQKFILKVIAESPTPLVIDADALNALADHLDILHKTKTPKILTPHPGEMARLIGWTKNKVERNRELIAQRFAKKFNCTLLLKGARTVVASPTGKIYINTTGNPGMATAGSGDVLTGIIAALLGQGLSAFEAARWGALIHGKAGDLAAKEKTQMGMIASDIIEYIPKAIKRLS